MKICRNCEHSRIALLINYKNHTKQTVPAMYLSCANFRNRSCSYVKKKCEVHDEKKLNQGGSNESKIF